MDGDQSWQARHDELRATLARTGTILGDKQTPTEERERAAAEFVTTWQEFCRHIKDHPDLISIEGPRD